MNIQTCITELLPHLHYTHVHTYKLANAHTFAHTHMLWGQTLTHNTHVHIPSPGRTTHQRGIPPWHDDSRRPNLPFLGIFAPRHSGPVPVVTEEGTGATLVPLLCEGHSEGRVP